MRITGWLVAAGTMTVAMPAAAQQGLPLQRGQSITITIGEEVKVTGAALATPTPFEAGVIAQAEANMYPDAVGSKSAAVRSNGLPAPDPIAPDTVSFRFLPMGGGKGSLLVVANGYDRALVYRARIQVAGKVMPTDVCTVLPAKRGFENWPFAIERIELGAFRLEPWDGGAPRCE